MTTNFKIVFNRPYKKKFLTIGDSFLTFQIAKIQFASC